MKKFMNPNRINEKAAVLMVVLGAFFTGGSAVFGESPAVIEVGAFSTETAINPLPAFWEPLYFKDIKRHTDYRLAEVEGQVVVKAVADASASGLTRKISIDPGKYPIVRWRWKVANVLKKGNGDQKEGDDYPARVIIAFEYDSGGLSFLEKVKYEIARVLYGAYPPKAAINYVWSSNLPVGLVAPNPYTNRTMMVVVESGKEKLNTWVHEERDIRADYRKAFKDDPPKISGVAIMTDTDDTGESATAYYGDIHFHKRRR